MIASGHDELSVSIFQRSEYRPMIQLLIRDRTTIETPPILRPTAPSAPRNFVEWNGIANAVDRLA